MYFHISTKGQPGSAWSPEEITRTKERIWKILVNPKKFVGKTKKPKEHGDCGSDCWKDCDALTKVVGIILSASIVKMSSVPTTFPSVSAAQAGQLDLDL